MSLPTFSFSTTAEEIAETFAAELKGKNVLITGTSLNGIGWEGARVMAKYCNLVIITGYNLERLKLTEEAIKKDVPSGNVRPLVLDLSSLAAVRKAAAEVNSWPEPLHVLIHNAAATIGPFKLTADGLESQIATDHIGPFLFTKLVTPKLLAAGTSTYVPRVLFLSSSAHNFPGAQGVNFDTVGKPNPETYTPFDSYFQAKSAGILTAIELSKRSKGKINSYSVDPGVIFTNINQKEESIPHMQSYGILGPDGQPSSEHFQWKTIPQGAATTMAASFDTRLNAVPGAYLSDGMDATKVVAPHSSDPANAARLWTLTEEIIGEKYEF
ncbi:hypothetical protein B0H16DRAFT_1571020 [Mycena metata]|uniref:Uncharacterized protein n=1 Tax=Mycena metata TaxID=1033252 RepID=A0AAD7MYT0_9AGAR|nr:hypothetical protein B0H16DRAFT_1571020 [Mycena metata]